MTELITGARKVPAYDPDSTGWIRPGGPDVPPPRPAAARVRNGSYLHPATGEPLWGDHRVSFPGTTCRQVSCYTSHYPWVAPGWPEPVDLDADGHGLYGRPGAAHIASALCGWNDAGHLTETLNPQAALHAAHMALDALRDAGFIVIAPTTAEQPTLPGQHNPGT